MLDDDRDKSLARNQLIAVVLMAVLLVVWMRFFMPQPQPRSPGQAQQTQQGVAQGTPTGPSTSSAAEPADTEEADRPSYLPPVAEQIDAAADEIVLENESLRAVFTRIGGRLKRAHVKLENQGNGGEIQLVPQPLPVEEDAPLTGDADVVYPLGLRFGREDWQDRLDAVRFEVLDHTPTSVTFGLALESVARIRKTFSLGDAPYVLNVDVAYENATDQLVVVGRDQTPAYTLNWGPNIDSKDKLKGVRPALAWRANEQYASYQVAKMKGKNGTPFSKTVADPEWLGVKSAYFMVAMKPEFEKNQGWALSTGYDTDPDLNRFRFGIAVPRFEVHPGEVEENSWRMYLGPCQRKYLAQAWDTLPDAKRFFESETFRFMDTFSKLLLSLLNWFYGVVPNYGLAIIFLTLLVRGGMYPLTLKQTRSMKKMQLLAPEIEQLKEKYKDEPQELQKKMMLLYRERGVNPIGGCLPLILQLPVFIALYRMLWSTFELRGAPFILLKFGDYAWIRDLSEPDRLIHLGLTGLPFLADKFEYLNILPILGAISMVLSTRMMPASTGPNQNPQQKMMMTIMPVFFGVICYGFASGLNLYILTSTVLGIVQNKLVRTGNIDVSEKKPERKRQHFYTAAKARQRRLTKSGKEGAKRPPSKGSRGDRPRKGTPKD